MSWKKHIPSHHLSKTATDFFKNNSYVPLRVNGKEYKNEVGISTTGGWYKNGWIVKIIAGKEGKHDYMQINFYTSVKHIVDIEEKLLIRMTDGKIVKRLGWNDVNLLYMMNEYDLQQIEDMVERRMIDP